MVRTSDDKKAFYLYNDYIDHVKLMSDEDAGKLFKAILEYENDLKVQELSGVAAMAFSFIKNQLDRDSSKYEEICKKNRANGMKGGRPRKNAEEQPNRTVAEENPENRTVLEQGTEEKQNEKPAKKVNSYPKNFEEFWAVYPRKDEKGVAYAKYAARIKDGYSPEELLQAATAYADQCKRLKTEKQFTKQAKTFLSDKAPFADFLKNDIKQEPENDGNGEVDFSKLVEV